MATPKGMSSKRQILDAAKQCFFEKGYIATTIKEIADRSNTKVGSVTYYYKRKEDIIYEIYQNIITEIYFFIKIHAEKSLSTAEEFMYFNAIFFKIIFSDKRNLRVYYEFQRAKTITGFFEEPLEHLVEKTIIMHHDISNENQLKMFALSYFGMRKELFFYFMEEKNDVTMGEFSSILLRITGLFLALTKKEINDTILGAEQFISINNITQIEYLVLPHKLTNINENS